MSSNDPKPLESGQTYGSAYDNGYRLSLDGHTMLDQYGKPATDQSGNAMVSDHGTMRRADGN